MSSSHTLGLRAAAKFLARLHYTLCAARETRFQHQMEIQISHHHVRINVYGYTHAGADGAVTGWISNKQFLPA
jgi:hypothetical protein